MFSTNLFVLTVYELFQRILVCCCRTLVMEKMEEMFKTSFHDANELTQATQFLHENGELSKIVTI